MKYNYPSYDSILQQMITDYSNLTPAPDVSIGSPVWIQASVIAQAVWGLYVYQSNGLAQAFPDSATGPFLDRWGNMFGVYRLPAEQDSDYSGRIVTALQTPAAGGTASDYVTWALAPASATTPIAANLPEPFIDSQVNISSNGHIDLGGILNPLGWVEGDPVVFSGSSLPTGLVAGTQYYVHASGLSIYIYSDQALEVPVAITSTGSGTVAHNPQAYDPNTFYVSRCQIATPNGPTKETTSPPGSVWLWLEPNDETILNPSSTYYPATNALVQTVNNYIETRRPITANRNIIQMEQLDPYILALTVSPVTVDTGIIASDIQQYMSNLTVGQRLYGAQLLSIALVDGAETATFTNVAGPDGTFNTAGGFDGMYIAPPAGHSIRLSSAPMSLIITSESI